MIRLSEGRGGPPVPAAVCGWWSGQRGRLHCSLMLLVLVALLATGCGLAAPGPQAVPTYAGPPERVIVGHSGFLNFAGLYAAIDNGFMRRQGIEVDLRVVMSGSETAKLLAHGQLDVAGIGLAARTFNAINRGSDMR